MQAQMIDDYKEIFISIVLSTISLQAETIDDLVWKLEIHEGAIAMKKKIMGLH
jgi:hypothetical protein